MSRQDITLDDIAAALSYLDCTKTDVWLRAGMAIKSEFGDAGFDVWDHWSRGDERYKTRDAKARWKSFKGGSARGKVSLGSVLHWAFERGFSIDRPELTPEQKVQFAKEQEDRRKQLAEQWAREEADILRWYDVVAEACGRLMPMLKPTGNSPYLGKKRISAHGALFAPCSFIVHFKPDFSIDIISGSETKDFFKSRTEDDVFLYFKRGSILIPIVDSHGHLRNFQVIYNDGKTKRFFTNGQKSGLHFVIGSVDNEPGLPVVLCEGFATGASIHECTGWPVIVSFDAGNLPVVAQSLAQREGVKLIAGDNDWETALDPKKQNTGVVKAKEAAAVLGCNWCVPQFNGDAAGLSDFNDLHHSEGAAVVKMQLEAALNNPPEMPPPNSPDSPPDYGDIPPPESAPDQYAEERQQSSGDETLARFTIEDLLHRFRLVIQDASVWDTVAETQIRKGAFNDWVGKTLADEWRAHPQRGAIGEQEIVEVRRARARAAKAARVKNEWEYRFSLTEKGEKKADIGNARLVLENDERWSGVISYCDFSYRVMKRCPPPFGEGSVGEWTDTDTDRLRIWLCENYGFTPKTADALGAVVVTAEANRYHPVREYGASLVWDGQQRLDFWLHAYLGAEASVYNSLVGKMFLLGAVARVEQPPVKMDNVLIFEGLQGLGKSTALKILAGDWFTDTPLVLGDKDGFQQMQGVWIIELAELDSFNKAEHTRAKQFFGSQTDRFRPSYGRLTQTFPRQCVFAGSTNQSEYLRDATGNRRYWPVSCTHIDAEALARDRDQLWAEAWHRYRQGDKWWPEDQHRHLFEEQQERRFEADVWEELIERWLRGVTRHRVLMHEIMEEALGLEASQMKPPEQKRVGMIMSHLGWTKVRARVPGGRETGYERPETWKIAA